MTTLSPIRRALEFDKKAAYAKARQTWINPAAVIECLEAEHARLAPLHEKLLAVVAAAEDALAQIKDQRGVWPAEVDTLEDRLADLRALSGGV